MRLTSASLGATRCGSPTERRADWMSLSPLPVASTTTRSSDLTHTGIDRLDQAGVRGRGGRLGKDTHAPGKGRNGRQDGLIARLGCRRRRFPERPPSP